MLQTMKVINVLTLFGSLLLCLPCYGQDKSREEWKIGIRHNGSRIYYEHPKIGLPGGPLVPPTSMWYNGQQYQHYYDEGIGVRQHRKILYYRLWTDYFHYLSEGYGWRFSGFRISPGTGREWQWNFIAFQAGLEMPIELKWWKIENKELEAYDPLTGKERIVIIEDYRNGIHAFALSAFIGVEFCFLKRFSCGLELRNGVWFDRNLILDTHKEYYNSQSQLYKTTDHIEGYPGWQKPNWMFLIPSVNLSYRFQR